MQGDHRLDALLAQLAQDVTVVPDLARIELTRRRLDARPLDGQPVGILVQLAQKREILAVAVVVIGRDLGGVAVCDPAGLLLELPPIAVAIVAFDLMGGTRSPPQESLGEPPHGCRHATVTGFSTLGGATYSQCTGLSPSMSTTSIPALSTALRYISRSLCGRPSSTIQAACSGSAWLTMAIVSPECSRASRRKTSRMRPPIRSTDSSPGTRPRLALCTYQSGRRNGMCQ